MKKFFGKIINYIKNTAWIQPLLIVCVIFLILFLLQPIANGIGSIVSCIGDKNSMTEITFKEYTEMEEEAAQKGTDDDPIEFIVVFTQDDCSHCAAIKPYINHYIKRNDDVKMYNVDVTFMTFVSAYGFVYIITPTCGAIMGGLALAKVEYSTWFRWALKVVLTIAVVNIFILCLFSLILQVAH